MDAAFVDQGTTTFLFSGDQYVRYSGPDYRHVDPGYPKPILGNLRTEGVFAALPDSFEDVVADRIAAGGDPVIDAAVGNGRSVYVFLSADCHVASRALQADYELAQTVGRVRNTLASRHRVDAALVIGEHTLLFSGDQYVRYTGGEYGFVDEGYPQALATSLPAELGFSILPEPFSDRIDAAVRGADGVTYLFTGDQYLAVDPAANQAAPAPQPITGTWGKVRNRFTADPADSAVDAAFCSPAGDLYVFKDGQYLRYQSPGQEYADEGFPRSVQGNWGDLPAPFEAGVDGACVLDGRTYLFCGDAYVRYSGASYHAVDRMYPQPFTQRWAPWADYLLTDVRAITGFKQLADTHPGDGGGLAAFLDSDQAAVPDPYRVLAGLFGWDADELRWLRRQHGFLPGPSRFEEGFQIEFVAAAVDLFAMAGLGAGPSAVFEQVWSPLYADDPTAPGSLGLDAAADALYRFLIGQQSEPDQPVLVRQLHDEINLLRRDALVAAVLGRDDTLHTARDVFERLLIDVEMGSRGLTSRVREALAATQLYFHRYFVGLEPATVPAGRDDAGVRQELKAWWTWLQNYRVWEANRQVFLYPENYLRPELRASKTPAFETLENDLMQGEITPQAAQRAYQKYLDEYTEVSRLTLAGGYVYASPDSPGAARRLVLFGATRTDPLRYYYRFWDYLGDDELSGSWSPWADVNVQIDADKVYPVFAFGRVFVFWAKIEAVTDGTPGAGPPPPPAPCSPSRPRATPSMFRRCPNRPTWSGSTTPSTTSTRNGRQPRPSARIPARSPSPASGCASSCPSRPTTVTSDSSSPAPTPPLGRRSTLSSGSPRS